MRTCSASPPLSGARSTSSVQRASADDHSARTTRWPMFATAVIEQTDVCALFAVPLQLGAIDLGVVDLYRSTPGPLGRAELSDVLAAADAATLLLVGAELRGEPDGRPDHGRQVENIMGRAVGRSGRGPQATGMLVVQLDIAAQDAFARLRAYAFAHRRPLGEVARDVVGRRLAFTPDME